MRNATRKVVVVLGSGRSGTSLLMQILVRLGMGVSSDLVPANASNTEGFYEHIDTIDIHQELFGCLSGAVTLPLPANWLDTDCAREAKTKLDQILKKFLAEQPGIVGLKDPRISTFLPLWLRLFNSLNVVPKFILAVRDPSCVVSSFVRHYNNSADRVELVWLLRMLDALEYTAGDCFIAHYEDWFSNSFSVVKNLLCYTGLNKNFGGDLSEVLADTIKGNLSHVRPDEYAIQNPIVVKLYSALQKCRGDDFDREELMFVVKECRRSIEGFKDWYLASYQSKAKLQNIENLLTQVKNEKNQLQKFHAELKEENRLMRQENQRLQTLAGEIEKLSLAIRHFEKQ